MNSNTSYKSIYFFPIGTEKVKNIIMALKPKTSCGHDSISPKLLKKLCSGFIEPFVHIINLSISSGIVPDAMKVAKVVPIFKNSGPDTAMKNYRPVSLLPVL